MDILLVDDDETLRQSISLLLANEGYGIQEASSGEEALVKARLHYFDLVLCDVRMPGIDGIQTLEQIRDSVDDAHFIVMTGYASEDAPIKALRLGVDDYLTKPFDIPIFLEKLRSIAKRRKSKAEVSGSSLWKLISSIKEHFPELAERCEFVEAKVVAWATELDWSTERIELLRLGAWYHPLSEGVSSQNKKNVDSEDVSEASALSDELAQLLKGVAREAASSEVNDLLRAAVLVAKGQAMPANLAPSVQGLLSNDKSLPISSEEEPNASEFELEVTTLGRFEVKVWGVRLDHKAWQSASSKWLFVYLMSRQGQSVPEDRLAELFWPESSGKKAHRALVSSVYRARKALNNSDLIVRYDKSYGISRECRYRLDSDLLLSKYKEATEHFYQERLDEALACFLEVTTLYQGPYIPQCHDKWCLKIRANLKAKTADAAEKAANILLDTDPARSEAMARKAIALESTSETGWSALIRALSAQGRRAEIETAYQQCVENLQEQLQLKPGLRLIQCYEDCLD